MNNTILIFDWDDTLFPTSWLKSKGIDFSNLTNIIPEDIKLELKNLDDICISLLNKVFKLGQVFIVTNSKNGWVKISSQLFLPQVYQFLYKIDIISACENYPYLPIKDCKVHTFRELLNNHIVNILSFGDSPNDIAMTESLRNAQINHGFENFYFLNETNQTYENNETRKNEISKTKVSKTNLT